MDKSYFERQHQRYLKKKKRKPETGLGCLADIVAIIVLIAIGIAFARYILGWQLAQIPHMAHAIEWLLLHFKLMLLAGVIAVVIIVFVAWRRDGEFL